MARILRTLLILVLTVALLPWGAWIRAASTQAPLAPVAAVEATLHAPRQSAVATLHCRTATLPGPACPADPALLPAALPEADRATARALSAADRTARGLFAPPGPDRPPRLA